MTKSILNVHILRFVLICAYLQGALVTLLNVYAPSMSEWKFFKHIFELLVSGTQGTLICGGDFYVRLHTTLDTSKPCHTGEEKKVTKNIKLMMEELGLSDIWRELNWTKKDFTFFSHPHLVYSRPRLLMFQKDMCRVTNCSNGTIDLSDHTPVYLNVILDFEKRRTN